MGRILAWTSLEETRKRYWKMCRWPASTESGRILYCLIWSFRDRRCPQIKRKPWTSRRLFISPVKEYCCPKEGQLETSTALTYMLACVSTCICRHTHVHKYICFLLVLSRKEFSWIKDLDFCLVQIPSGMSRDKTSPFKLFRIWKYNKWNISSPPPTPPL